MLVSVVKDDIVFADPEFHKRETMLLGSRNALSADFARVIAAHQGRIDPDARAANPYLAAGNSPQRFPELIAGADDVLKAIVRF